MSKLVAIGTLAFDSIETPFGKTSRILGGSVNHFSLSASHFVPVQCVSVVGEDFPKEHLELLQSRNVDTKGIRIEKGSKTFAWEGKYGYDLNEAQTLATHLNVLEKFNPEVPPDYAHTEFLFLGNIVPALQERALDQMKKPKFVAIDTMNFWIERQREATIKAISRCNALIINEGEVRQITQTYNIVQAAQIVRSWGPQVLVVKRGEYGAVLFDHGEAFIVPGMPLTEVKDPTGAGDSFAGGFMGYLASQSPFNLSRYTLRKAVVYGSVMASFNVEEFGFQNLLKLSRERIDERYQRFIELTTFHV